LSLEALSRGAAEVVLVDASRTAVGAIRENLHRLGCADRARVWAAPVLPTLRALARRGQKFNLIFLDPPYEKGIVASVMRVLGEVDLLEPDGVVILEHSAREKVDPGYQSLALQDERRYGTTVLAFFRRRSVRGAR
jgi:16S rRNA (guanine(966)-N(2))-methyltransferase RsmD